MHEQNINHVAVVIPCYRVRQHILDLITQFGPEVSRIFVVDDACPDETGALVERQCKDQRVVVLRHVQNQGVGGAVLTGMNAALKEGHKVVVKIDGDGQMDPSLLPLFVNPILAGQADVTKGNRFYELDGLRTMPTIRLLGNAALSFLAKMSTGYWNIFDPTNGYIAIDTRLIAALPNEKIHRRYFFETDLLFRCGLCQAKVLDIPMKAIYADEKSNLKIHREIPRFFAGHIRNFGKRIFYNYFLRDFNVASLELLLGVICIIFGIIFGAANWGIEEPATAGTVMIAALPLLTGLILLISFINFDAQQVPREAISPRLGEAHQKWTGTPVALDKS